LSICFDDASPLDRILFEQIKPELHKIDNIVAQEVPLYSSLLGLAGRVDCVADYDGKKSIIDFKGSTREKRKEDIDNYFMQATAYAIMFQERTGIKIDNIVILISSEDGAVQSFVDNPIKYTKKLFNCIENYCNLMQ
jgi:genome maintenance exonuclease 1